MSKQLSAIRQLLTAKADQSNLDFFGMMIPGQQKMYGVKTPELNAIAKTYQTYSFKLAEELWASGALEEKIIAIKIMEKEGKKDPARLLQLFKKFAGSLDNWAVCDGLGTQFLRGIVKTHAKEIFLLASMYNKSKDPWQRRLSLVMVEWFTRFPEYHAAIGRLMAPLEKDPEHYVKKAVQWIRRNLKKKIH